MLFKTSIASILLVTHVLATKAFGQWEHTGGLNNFGNISCFAEAGNNLFAGAFGDTNSVWYSSDDGDTWVALGGLYYAYPKALLVKGTSLFAATISGVYVSTDSGKSWGWISQGLPKPLGVQVTSLVWLGTELFAGTEGGLYVSNDSGLTWIFRGASLNTPYSLFVHDTNIFVSGGGIFLSTDKGLSWSPVNDGLPSPSVTVHAFVADSTNLYAGVYGFGVYASTNNGASWSERNSGLSNYYVEALATSGANLFAGTSSGVFLSTNHGLSWTEFNTGLGDSLVRALMVKDGYLYAGTRSSGVWRCRIANQGTVTTLDSQESGPKFNSISPNPISGHTNIKFTTSTNGLVELNVFDILGKKYFTLPPLELVAGTHSVEWDASMVADGVYFCLLRQQNGLSVSVEVLVLH